MATRVLLVEDDARIGALVVAYLERDGFETRWSRTGADALHELARFRARLVILDVGLPDTSGFALCAEISRATAVIMLTARDAEPERVAGLEAGADDYVTKPFSPRELMARVHAVLRRSRLAEPAEAISIGALTLRPARREVTAAGRPVPLTAREFDLLLHLARRGGAVAERAELLTEVWGFASQGETRTIDVHVAQLRRKLGGTASIETVRGHGYRLVAV